MTIKDAKTERVDAEIEEIAQRILLELENVSSKDLSDVHYAKKILHLADIHYAKRILQQMGRVTKQSSGAESEIEKRAVIKVLLFSTWLHRLFHHKISYYGTCKFRYYISFRFIPGDHRHCFGGCT